MKKLSTLLASAFVSASMMAQGWPANYNGVMLQGFFWDSYTDTQWTNLESQAQELSEYFNLVWVPNSGNCNTSWNNMGYMPVFYYDQNSSFGTESQLRSMISTFKKNNVGVIADVVVNHRNNLGVNGSWVDYPVETYNGTQWTMYPTDIVANDDNGKTATWAKNNGISLSSNYDTGEGWDGCRDLDHKSENVRKNIINYIQYLKNDLGYAGYRYDMVKGYSASYTGEYNKAADAEFSVGEYWDGNTGGLKYWVNGTKVDGVIQSAAFDFALRYAVRDACNSGSWNNLAKAGLNRVDDYAYSRYAVTFVENHDTQYRSASEPNDPVKNNIEAANAYLLCSPGTPCVFLKHWKDYKEEIKQMINARRLAGITNQSKILEIGSAPAYYVMKTNGDNGKYVYLVTGNYNPDNTSYMTLATSGKNYKIYLSNNVELPWASKPSGTYSNSIDVTLTAISEDKNARLVYTTDGTEPTASSTAVNSGAVINIAASTVLKVALLKNGTPQNTVIYNYTIKVFEPHKATVYVQDPGWNSMYFYAWDGSKSLLGEWPGTKMTTTTEINGKQWYSHSFDVNTADYSFNIIFNQGNGKPQTVDIGPITSDKYYVLSSSMTNGKYTVTDITDTMTGIEGVVTSTVASPTKVYSIDGRLLYTMPEGSALSEVMQKLDKGLYIINGKKYLKR